MLQPSDHRPNNDIGDDNNNVNEKIEESELKGVEIKSKTETTDTDDATDQAKKKKKNDQTEKEQTRRKQFKPSDRQNKNNNINEIFWKKPQLSRNSRRKDHKQNRQIKSQWNSNKTSDKTTKATPIKKPSVAQWTWDAMKKKKIK